MIQRRALLRYPAPPNFTCLVDHPFTRLYLRAEVRDISRAGIGIILSMELTPGMVVDIEVAGVRKPATLRYTREYHEDQWFAGFSFDVELTPEELDATGVIGS